MVSLKPGPKGVKGDRGPTGSKGDQGSTGSSGQMGSKGSRGSTGSKGSTGSSGQKGSKGDRGSKGLKGVSASGLELRGGTYKSGNVFITNSNGYHGPVCDDVIEQSEDKTANFARVVCRQLGFTGGTTTQDSKFGEVPPKFAMDDVNCGGSEINLLDCPHTTTDNGNA